MRIACPNCEATYDVPTDRLGPGRTVRCARCSTAWAPVPPPSPPSPDPQNLADPAPPLASVPDLVSPIMPFAEPAVAVAAPPNPVQAEPIERIPLRSTSAPRPSSQLLLLGAWVVSFGVLVGLGWAAVAYRETVLHVWPPSERAYSALGLAARPLAPSATPH